LEDKIKDVINSVAEKNKKWKIKNEVLEGYNEIVSQ
jgi:hypothetical protein